VKKIKTSVALAAETIALADSIATATDRSRSWVIDRAILAGLPTLDTPQAKALRSKKKDK
jgi:predicted transcriptional regulator